MAWSAQQFFGRAARGPSSPEVTLLRIVYEGCMMYSMCVLIPNLLCFRLLCFCLVVNDVVGGFRSSGDCFCQHATVLWVESEGSRFFGRDASCPASERLKVEAVAASRAEGGLGFRSVLLKVWS